MKTHWEPDQEVIHGAILVESMTFWGAAGAVIYEMGWKALSLPRHAAFDRAGGFVRLYLEGWRLLQGDGHAHNPICSNSGHSLHLFGQSRSIGSVGRYRDEPELHDAGLRQMCGRFLLQF